MEAIVLAATLLFGAPPDPYRLYSPNKSFYAKEIVQAAANSPIPPAEALAIALTESNLNPRAYSRTKDVGLFQVNCKWWYKKFKYASIKKCEKALLDPFKNIEAGLFIFATSNLLITTLFCSSFLLYIEPCIIKDFNLSLCLAAKCLAMIAPNEKPTK